MLFDEEPSETSTNFAAHMRRLRNLSGISQAELARRAVAAGQPMHQQTIAKIESGQRPIGLDEAEALATLLGRPLSTMLRPVDDVDLSGVESPRSHADIAAAVAEARARVAQKEAALGAAEIKLAEAQQHALLAANDVARLRVDLIDARQTAHDRERLLETMKSSPRPRARPRKPRGA